MHAARPAAAVAAAAASRAAARRPRGPRAARGNGGGRAKARGDATATAAPASCDGRRTKLRKSRPCAAVAHARPAARGGSGEQAPHGRGRASEVSARAAARLLPSYRGVCAHRCCGAWQRRRAVRFLRSPQPALRPMRRAARALSRAARQLPALAPPGVPPSSTAPAACLVPTGRGFSNLPLDTVYGGPSSPNPKRVTLRTLDAKFKRGEPISMVTAYDYPSAVHVRPRCAATDGRPTHDSAAHRRGARAPRRRAARRAQCLLLGRSPGRPR